MEQKQNCEKYTFQHIETKIEHNYQFWLCITINSVIKMIRCITKYVSRNRYLETVIFHMAQEPVLILQFFTSNYHSYLESSVEQTLAQFKTF